MLESFHKYPVFPDLLENQRRSIKFFWEKGILDELELFSTILGYNKEKNPGKSLQVSATGKVQNTPLLPKSPGRATLISDLKKTRRSEGLTAQNRSNLHLFQGFLSSRMAKPSARKPSSPRLPDLRWVPPHEIPDRRPLVLRWKNEIPAAAAGGSRSLRKQPLVGSARIRPAPETFSSHDLRSGESSAPRSRTVGLGLRPKVESYGPLVLNENIKTQQLQFTSPVVSNRVLRHEKILKLAGKTLTLNKNGPVSLKINSEIGQKYNENLSGQSPVEPDFLVLHGSKFVLKAPYYSQNQAIQYQKTYSVGLFLPVSQKSARQSCQDGTTTAEAAAAAFGSRSRSRSPTDSARLKQSFFAGRPWGIRRYPLMNAEQSSGFSTAFGPGLRPANPYPNPNLQKTQKFSAIEGQRPANRAADQRSGGASPSEVSRPKAPGDKVLVEDQEKVWFYFGDIPLMTDRGSFIINGAPRVLVNQIIRCPSVYFKVKLDQKNRRTYIASFLSEYGSWLRLETDRLGKRIWARIDKSPRFPAELLLLGLGYTDKGISKRERASVDQRSHFVQAQKAVSDRLRPAAFGRLFKAWPGGSEERPPAFLREPYAGRVAGLRYRNSRRPDPRSVVNSGPTDVTMLESSRSRTRQSIRKLNDPSGENFVLPPKTPGRRKTEDASDQNRLSASAGVALQTIWKKCNPGRWTSSLGCYSFFYNKFLNPKRYSIGRVGRLRLNKRLLRNPDCCLPTLTPEDILLAFNYLRQLRSSDSFTSRTSSLELDDIDHLKNRRVRLPGEILQNQFRLALSRITWSALRFQNQALTADRPKERSSRPSVEDPRSSTKSFPGLRPAKIEPSGGLRPLTEGPGASGRFTRPEATSANQRSGRDLRSFGPLGKMENSGPAIPAFQNTLRELFNTGQLSQYMDQTNPLAEITHKRRLSSLGPGGVGRDQAGFAVREIHPSHFGRICPIETPEGQNAGLVGSLASYARINGDGFLQSPCIPIETKQTMERRSGKGRLARGSAGRSPGPAAGPAAAQPRLKISLFSSELEDEIYVCTGDTLNPISRKPDTTSTSMAGEPAEGPQSSQFSVRRAKPSFIKEGLDQSFPQFPSVFPVRYKQEFVNIKKMDALNLTAAPTKLFTGVCPIQLISIATSLIPFLEHDDANRALMGSNMQRQAVPFLLTEKPFVGTGLELQAARDSSTLVLAKQSGQVIFLDSNFIEIQRQDWDSSIPASKEIPDESFPGLRPSIKKRQPTIHSYALTNFLPSNQSTCLKQKPAVEIGEWVEKGSLLADGAGTKDGEVTLGKNVLLAYMPWEGYNFEDAIVINERLVFEDIYTSIHVERFDVDIKNTKILSLCERSAGSHREPSVGSDRQSRGGQSPPGLAELRSPGLRRTFGQPPASREQNVFSETNTSFLRIDQIGAGEYLTSDLDLFTLKVGASAAAEGRSRSELRSPAPRNQSRPRSLHHLDKNGIVKPGTWVQEGDILVGKIQLGGGRGSAEQSSGERSSAERSSREGFAGGRETPPYGNLTEKTPTLPSNAKNLPFPEYRLLLAIFELQNPRSGTESRVDKTLGTAEKKVLESEMLEMTEGLALEGTEPTAGPGLRPAEPRTSRSVLQKGEKDGRLPKAAVATKTITTGSNARFPNVLRNPQALQNTSAKVGIGVKGRVLECLFDGNLPPVKERRSSPETFGPPAASASDLRGPSAGEARPNVVPGEAHLGFGLTQARPGHQIEESYSDYAFCQHRHTCSYVSVFLAHKKRIQLGDKMSGRHGNKGIVSLILAPQDMPYLQDGKPVDVVLNPLGVPSRMNVGQVLETLFGLSAFYSQKIYRILPFDERMNPRLGWSGPKAREAPHGQRPPGKAPETSRSLVYGYLRNLRKTLKGRGDWLFDPNNPGKTLVFDGRTGESFYQPVLVGYSYMFKLIHLVDDKIHARSTGPYSLVTQQPLGGRSKKGGQRLGEMEVWALQGFGTASILQEFLTVKSDEIYSRNHFLFHLMRRNWESLENIPRNGRSIEGFAQPQAGTFGGLRPPQASSEHSPAETRLLTPGAGTRTSDGPSVSRLPESFRVLMNELHALCLSVYSNLPN